MPELLISGNSNLVRDALLTASAIIKLKQAIGFELFEADEEWRYESWRDDHVCPVCTNFDRDEFFAGDRVLVEFQKWQRMLGEGIGVIHPRVHWDPQYSWLLGECRCRVFMLNIAETLVNRLDTELKSAIIQQLESRGFTQV